MPPNNSATLSATGIYKKVTKLMGNRFEITVVTDEEDFAGKCIEEAITEIRRIETLLTTFNEDSQTNLINSFAGIKPVKVDREVIDIIRRAERISNLTQGAFDISYGSIDKRLWNFDKNMQSLPDELTARSLVRLINFRNIMINDLQGTVFLKERGMRIGFGGIGKGYAAEQAKFILQELGIKAGVVNAAGDLVTWGHPPDADRWTIGIADPNAVRTRFSALDVTDMAVATSGNYEKFVMIGGKKYSHTIDPKTGLPVTGIKSVTILCGNAEVADAMATPVMIMGIKVGLDLINQIRGMACIIVDDNDEIHVSKNITLK